MWHINLKFGQILISASIGLLVFVSTYITENSRFDRISKVKNPFAATLDLNEKTEVKITDGTKNLFSKTGEFWMAEPNTILDFSANNRELFKGNVVLTANYISEEDEKIANESFFEDFDVTKFTPKIGQIKVGKLIVSCPGATCFISRDPLRSDIFIYAHDHSIEIFLPGSKMPFVLPPRNSVSILEKNIDRSGKLFYTKLKKEFHMEFVASVIQTEKTGTKEPPFEIKKAIEEQNKVFKEIRIYAENAPFSWNWFDPQSPMGSLIRTIRYLQRYYALGIDENFKSKYMFDSLRKDLIGAFFALDSGNLRLTKDLVKNFEKIRHSNEWVKFMIQNPKYIPGWEVFERSQKILMRNIYPDEKEYVFNSIWFPEIQINSFHEFKKRFSEIEKMISQGQTTQAKDTLITLGKSFPEIKDIKKEDRASLTKIRRLVIELLHEETFLQLPDVFQFYGKLVQSEMALYSPTEERTQEFSLESAQDILYFLKIFIDMEGASRITNSLVDAYKILNIDAIAENLGRDIFSNDEKETIKVVQFINSNQISNDEMSNIQEQQSLLSWMLWRLKGIEGKKTDPKKLEDDGSIRDQKALTDFLKQFYVETEGIRMQEQAKSDNVFILFDRASYMGKPMKGTFQSKNQIFSYLKIGDQEENSFEITLDLFPQVIKQLVKTKKTIRKTPTTTEKDPKKETPEKPITETTEPKPETKGDSAKKTEEETTEIVELEQTAENSAMGILGRTVVSRELELQNILVHIDNIKILNLEYTEFGILEGILNNRYKLRFKYDQKTKTISSVRVEAGQSKFMLPGKTFPMENLSKNLTQIIEEKLNESALKKGR